MISLPDHQKNQKSAWRQACRHQLRHLPQETITHAGQQLKTRLLQNHSIQKAGHIGCYLPMPGELSTTPFIKHMLAETQKNLYAPVTHTTNHRLMYGQITNMDDCRLGNFNLLEPTETAWIHPHHLEIIIIPVLAIDQAGYRLGHGHGYFDRTLISPQNRVRPLYLAVAYSWQVVKTLPHDDWDLPVDDIIVIPTEAGP